MLRTFHKRETVPANPAGLLFPPASKRAEEVVAFDEPSPAALLEVDGGLSLPGEALKEVIAIIRPERWIKTKLKVEALGITAFTHHRVVGRGRQRGLQFLARRGAVTGTGFRYLPKRMVSWIVPESQVERLVQAIMEANRTGQIGDGKIFVLPIDGVMQIRASGAEVEAFQSAENVFAND
jgi:nitrogen regulatory protein PII 2